MTENFTFRRAKPGDDELVDHWFHAPHVVEFWGDASTNIADFRNTMSGDSDLFNYWIALDQNQGNDTPICLLITTNAATGMPEHLAPFLPETGEAWTLDVLIGPVEYIGRGIAVKVLESFLRHIQHLNGDLQTVFIDPEANNPRAIHVYEKAGFQKISTFSPLNGPFRGRPHILMAYHCGQAE